MRNVEKKMSSSSDSSTYCMLALLPPCRHHRDAVLARGTIGATDSGSCKGSSSSLLSATLFVFGCFLRCWLLQLRASRCFACSGGLGPAEVLLTKTGSTGAGDWGNRRQYMVRRSIKLYCEGLRSTSPKTSMKLKKKKKGAS